MARRHDPSFRRWRVPFLSVGGRRGRTVWQQMMSCTLDTDSLHLSDIISRLLYVACTRAQGFLYLTHASSRMAGGETKKRSISTFVSALSKAARVCLPSRLALLMLMAVIACFVISTTAFNIC
jgi:hypothetical protein